MLYCYQDYTDQFDMDLTQWAPLLNFFPSQSLVFAFPFILNGIVLFKIPFS